MASPPKETRYTAADLARMTGLSERTVRYYVAEGLLPAPARGRGANFEPDHLTRLRLIRAMQEAGNELETIRLYLAELDVEMSGRRGGLEEVLAVWSARTESAALRERLYGVLSATMVSRYRIAEGVELTIDVGVATPNLSKLRQLLQTLRDAFESE